MKRFLTYIAAVLVTVGALNWGLWGFFQFDFIAWLVHGNTNALARFIYAIIGLAGVWSIGWVKQWQCLCGCCSCAKEQGAKR